MQLPDHVDKGAVGRLRLFAPGLLGLAPMITGDMGA